MKKPKLRYTEHKLGGASSKEGIIKVLVLHALLGPLRLVNEASQKILFLGTASIRRVTLFATILNGILFVWCSLLWPYITGVTNPFIPTWSSLLSFIVLAIIFYKSKALGGFSFTLLPYTEESTEIPVNDVLIDDSFSEIKAADIAFEESINIFIKDPSELEAHNIVATVYQAAEDNRIVEALSTSGSFVSSPISLPDFLTEPPLGSQIADNFNSMHADLASQLSTRDDGIDLSSFEIK